jgi:hypothetical protein
MTEKEEFFKQIQLFVDKFQQKATVSFELKTTPPPNDLTLGFVFRVNEKRAIYKTYALENNTEENINMCYGLMTKALKEINIEKVLKGIAK